MATGRTRTVGTTSVEAAAAAHHHVTAPHQLDHPGVKHDLHLVLVLPAAEHEVAGLEVAVDDGAGLPARGWAQQQQGSRGSGDESVGGDETAGGSQEATHWWWPIDVPREWAVSVP